MKFFFLFLCILIITKNVSTELEKDKYVLLENAQHSYISRTETKGDPQKFNSPQNLNDMYNMQGIFLLDLSKESNVSERCLNDTLLVQKDFKSGKEWAIKVVDSFGKVPAGVLNGHIHWFGDYVECRRIRKQPENEYETKSPFDAKYCLADLQYNGKKESITLPPVKYAVCMPESCSKDEIRTMLNRFIQSQIGKQGNSSITADAVMCKSPPKEYDTYAYIAITFLLGYGALMAIATAYDAMEIWLSKQRTSALRNFDTENGADGSIKVQGENETEIKGNKSPLQESKTSRILRCFSLYSNGKKILNTHQSMTQLSALNGIRFLSISWVVLGHTYYFSVIALSNMVAAAPDHLNRLWSQVIATSNISVDSFYALSGLLVSFFMLKELQRTGGKLNWFMVYFHRYWRLSPPYLLLIFLTTALSKYMGDGPLWPDEGFLTEKCQKTWWYNVLYINNFVPRKSEMCMGWSWYLATDMQFYIISPFLLLLLFRHEIIGNIVLFLIAVASMTSAGIISYTNSFLPGAPKDVYAGDNDYGSAFMVLYIKPYNRIGPYIVGLFTGYVLYKTNFVCNFKKIVVLICWGFAAFFGCLSVFGLHKKFGFFGELTLLEGALYQACNRTVWACSLCWVIFACATGNGGIVNTLMSWKPFVVLGRLSYCIYLIHPLILDLFYNNAITTIYYTDLVQTYAFLAQLFASSLAAFVMSLMLETPMMGLEKILLKR